MRSYDEALSHARQNAAVPLYKTGLRRRLNALLQLAIAKVYTNTPLEEELEIALQLSEQLPPLRPSVAATTFVVARRMNVPQEVLDAATAIVNGLPLGSPLEDTAVAMYAEWLSDRDPAAAREVLDRVVAANRDVSLPWEWSYLRFRLTSEEQFDERWTLLQAALQRLTEDIPGDTSGGLLAGWLGEKEAFLNDLVAFAKKAYRQGKARPQDLAWIANVASGRDVVIPLSEKRKTVLPKARLIAFLEDDADIWIVAVTPDTESIEIVPDVLVTKDVIAANAEFQRAIRRALPGRASRADGIIAPLLRSIGSAAAKLSPADEHLCFIPSESLVAVPLHAATVDDGTLLVARNPISVSPNLSMTVDLIQAVGGRDGGGSVIVTVPKRGDAEPFASALREAAAELEQLAPGGVEALHETEATKEGCGRAAREAQHAVFLCHGGDAGPRYGRGLCVSDQTDLPPSLLPVADAPSLRRFIITAEDVESWDPSPEMFATIACSSGLAISGPGGSRLGVERSLLMNGCRTILAPLWDVDYRSALKFIVDFHRICRDNPELDLGRAHQRATLLAHGRSPHLFDWAPMQLKGSWMRPKGEPNGPGSADSQPVA
jgi:CHAT domain-containing protein